MGTSDYIILSVWAVCWPTGFRFPFRDMTANSPVHGWGELTAILFMSVFMGLIIGPIIVLGRSWLWAVNKLPWSPDQVARKLAGETKDEKLWRREKELSDREKHVERLEQELLER